MKKTKNNLIDPTKDKFLLDYLFRLKEHHKYMGYRSTGVDSKVRAIDRPTSNRMYVVPNFTEKYLDPGTKIEKWTDALTIDDLLTDYKKLFLLGDPGIGKTTLTDRLTYVLSDLNLRPSFSKYGELIPFILTLRDLKYEGVNTWEDLLNAYFKLPKFSDFQEEIANNQALIRQLLQNGQALIMLDGLDEINDKEMRQTLSNIVLEGMEQFPDNYWWFTSRIVGFEQYKFWGLEKGENLRIEKSEIPDFFKESGAFSGDTTLSSTKSVSIDISIRFPKDYKKFPERYLAPFSNEQIKQFITQWYHTHEPRKHVRTAAIELFLEDLESNENIQHLARIPNLLSMMAIYHDANQRFPDGRIELYDTVVKLYLDKIYAQRRLKKLHTLEFKEEAACLRDIAFKMQQLRTDKDQDKEVHLTISEAEVREIMLHRLKAMRHDTNDTELENLVQQYFKSLHQYSAILIPKTNEDYGFLHLSYQEYFAAEKLQEKLQKALSWESSEEDRETFWKELKGYAAKNSWHESIVLFFEGFSFYRNGGRAECNLAFKEIFAWDKSKGEIDLYYSLAAAKVLANEYISKNFKPAERFAALDYIWLKMGQHSHTKENEFLTDWGQKNGHYLVLKEPFAKLEEELTYRWVIVDAEFTAFAQLAKMPQMAYLKMEKTSVADLTVLQDLHNLQYLNLNETQVSDLKLLENFKNLRHLNLNQTQVSDLKLLENLKNLRHLNLTQTQVSDLKPLENLKELSVLFFNQTQVSDLKPLENLHNLQYLNLNQTQVRDLKPLENLNKLIWLESNQTQVSDLKPLENLKHLSWLYLKQTQISDLKPLENLRNLSSLYLNQTQTSVETIADLLVKNPTLSIVFENYRVEGNWKDNIPSFQKEIDVLLLVKKQSTDKEEIGKKIANAHGKLSTCQLHLQDFKKAIISANKAYEFDAKHTQMTMMNVVLSLLLQNQYAEATATYLKAMKIAAGEQEEVKKNLLQKIEELKEEGITHPDMDKLIALVEAEENDQASTQ